MLSGCVIRVSDMPLRMKEDMRRMGFFAFCAGYMSTRTERDALVRGAGCVLERFKLYLFFRLSGSESINRFASHPRCPGSFCLQLRR